MSNKRIEKENRSSVLLVSITPRLHEDLKLLAILKDQSKTEVVVRALKEYVYSPDHPSAAEAILPPNSTTPGKAP